MRIFDLSFSMRKTEITLVMAILIYAPFHKSSRGDHDSRVVADGDCDCHDENSDQNRQFRSQARWYFET